ncbi:MAG: hypothetical protein KME10_27065 [Plectolyngbya sp. WJT66-NPBG17]|jgi:hypothetical protein|nr:hypothetical protein [Plectolyngbya sp. WJT66-NPBG17]MBW4528825.1 hypothetical protein [Phormidium tanganyikae FI6-MK23]
MKSQVLVRSSFGMFVALSLFACQSSFAQTSLQIRNNSMVIQSGGKTMVLNAPSSSIYSSSKIIQTNSTQRTAVTLNTTSLKRPCWLTVAIAKGQLNGQIKIGNQVIQSLKGSRTVVNLAPYLSSGTKTIDISGKYQPARGSLRIEFSGAGTQVSQQASGSGIFNHRLIVTVR